MKNLRCSCGKSRRGQALIEFALLTVFVIMLMTAAGFEASRYASLALRLASSTREAGRLFTSEEIAPVGTDYNSNYSSLYSEIKTKVYDPTQQMIYPADLPTKGTMIVSIIKRYDPNGNTAYNPSNLETGYSEYDPATETDDAIKVEYQFIYRGTEAPVSWVSTYGAVNSTITSLPLSTLRVDERAVIVELFHKVDSIFPDGALQCAKLDYIYDKAIF